MIDMTVYDNDLVVKPSWIINKYNKYINDQLDLNNKYLNIFRKNDSHHDVHTVIYLNSLPKIGEPIPKIHRYYRKNGEQCIIDLKLNLIRGILQHKNHKCSKNYCNNGSLELYWREGQYYKSNIYKGEQFFYNNMLYYNIPNDIGMILFDLKDMQNGFVFDWLCHIPNTDLTLQLIGEMHLDGGKYITR